MRHRSRLPLLLVVSALASAPLALVSQWQGDGYVLTEDQNRDGRPDVWRIYDRQHQLSETTVDTNFDGRSDVHEYYEHGALVRRESDRDFNRRIDLVEEFDPATSAHVRSVVDVDSDGTADLLILFQDGRPVFSKTAHQAAPTVARSFSAQHAFAFRGLADDQLAPLADPFLTDLAVRAERADAGGNDFVGLCTSGGLPASYRETISPLAISLRVSGPIFARLSSVSLHSYSPRGPPASPLSA